MKFKDTDGNTLDTHKMDDVTSMLLEKAKDFVDFAEKYKVPFLLRWHNPINNTVAGAQNFNHNVADLHKVMFSIDYFLKQSKTNYKLIHEDEDFRFE
jgi:hypothetical protein